MKVLSLFILLTFTLFVNAQDTNWILQSEQLIPPSNYANIHVQNLFNDTLSSVFCIWIKKEVKLHKHASHTEQVMVLEGEGKMQLNGKETLISKGSIINIPKGTPHKVTVTSTIPLKVISIQSPRFDGTDRIILE